MSSLPSDALTGLVSLTSLEIKRNLLTLLPANLLHPLTSLQILDLSYNQISQVEPDAFKYLTELRVLRLEENNLSEIPAGLEYLPNLVELHLHRNRIQIIPDHSLPLPSLSSLDIRNNKIEEIQQHSFTQLNNLRTLRISGNRLNRVPTSALAKLSNLEILYLGHNNYFQIRSNSLPGLYNLRKLDISGCPALVSIEDSAFSENSNLVDVSITGNKMLSLLGPATFTGNPELERVDLSDNRLEIIPSSLLPWHKLKHLQISGNPLNCGCQNYFLRDVIHQMVNSSEAGIRVVRCWSPLQVRDQDLALIQLDDCTVHSSTSRYKDNDTLVTIVGVASVLSVLCILTVLALVARFRRSRYTQHTGVPDKDILHYPDSSITGGGGEPRYVVSNYPTMKTNIVTNPYHQTSTLGAGKVKPGCLLAGGGSPYQENVVLITTSSTGSPDITGTLYPRASHTLLYKDKLGEVTTSCLQQQQIMENNSTATFPNNNQHNPFSNQSNSDSGFSDYKSQVSTWSNSRLQEPGQVQVPAGYQAPGGYQEPTQYSHIYADPIQTNNQVTTLLRFDPKSHYEDPLALF